MKTRFEDLLERHEKEIYRFAWRMTGNRDDAADVLQETFLRAFKAFCKLPPDANYRAWLYKIASRLALNHARSVKGRRSVPIDEAFHLPERNGDLESLVETKRLAGVLTGVLDRLPLKQRVALLQRKYEGLSYREIATTLDCSEETARAHVYQAMEKVRRGLDVPRKRGGQKTRGGRNA